MGEWESGSFERVLFSKISRLYKISLVIVVRLVFIKEDG
jgi:hypothetical protein